MDLFTQSLVNTYGPAVSSALWMLGILVLLTVSAVLAWRAWRLRDLQDGTPIMFATFAFLPMIASVFIALHQELVWGGLLVLLWLFVVVGNMVANTRPRRRF